MQSTVNRQVEAEMMFVVVHCLWVVITYFKNVGKFRYFGMIRYLLVVAKRRGGIAPTHSLPRQ
jgi:hypothetical protein